jgi:hypothetical protein
MGCGLGGSTRTRLWAAPIRLRLRQFVAALCAIRSTAVRGPFDRNGRAPRWGTSWFAVIGCLFDG